jgi:hypothetical protein
LVNVGKDETSRLIASSKVEGTEVYNKAGEHLGEVITLWSTSSPATSLTHAVMSFGFLGIGLCFLPALRRIDWGILQTSVFSIALERRENRRIAVSAGAELVDVFRMGLKRWMVGEIHPAATLERPGREGAVYLLLWMRDPAGC